MESSQQKNLPESEESIPLSSINTYLYCPRRAGLQLVELAFSHNHHTVQGKHFHQRADLPGSHNLQQVMMIRSLPVWSQALKVHGRCDVVEKHADGTVVPVEYKKGRLRAYRNDDAQVCAQGLCLEEMFGITLSHGVVFHASSKRRRRVDYTDELRTFTKDTIESIHALIANQTVPQAVHSHRCPGCSLKRHCLPEITDVSSWSYNRKNIFAPRELKKSS